MMAKIRFFFFLKQVFFVFFVVFVSFVVKIFYPEALQEVSTDKDGY
jgi:hypothetical protein